MNTQFPLLKYWFNAYLHQDFDLEHGSPDNALFAFKAEASTHEIENLYLNLGELIQSNCDEITLKDLLLRKLDCCYYYPGEWNTATDWLRHLQGLLKQ